MKYTKETLPDIFTAINSAETPIKLRKLMDENERYELSSEFYDDDFYYSTDRVLYAINNGTWQMKKIILIKQFDYEIY